MGKQKKQWQTCIFSGSKITADGDCSHEIQRCLLLGRKATTNLDSILKSRDITLQTKVRLVKIMVFPAVMYEDVRVGTIKKAEGRRIDPFELRCWKRLLRVPWTARRSNQSILKEIIPEYLLERLMLKLKLQHSGHLMQRTDSLMLGNTEGRRRRGWQRMRWMASPTQWTWVWASSEIWWWTGRSGVLQSMGLQRVRHDWATELNLTWSNYSQGIPTTCWFWNQFYIDSTKDSWLNITMLSKPKPLTVWNKLWKIMKDMGIPDHLTCLLRNLYTGQEATVKTGHGTTDWFQIGKGVRQGCISSPCLFNLYAEYIMRNVGLEEAQAGIRLPGEISITSDMQMTPPLGQKVKRN